MIIGQHLSILLQAGENLRIIISSPHSIPQHSLPFLTISLPLPPTSHPLLSPSLFLSPPILTHFTNILTTAIHIQGRGSYPFKELIFCNIGDVQAMGHQPITYIRQLITVCLSPAKYFESGSDRIKTLGNTRETVRQLLTVLSDELPSNDLQRLLGVVDKLSPATEERVGDLLDDIPRDVKKRANILLNSLGGRSLGMYHVQWNLC